MTSGPIAKPALVTPIRAAVLVAKRPERQDELLPLGTLVEFPDTGSTADTWGKVEADDTQLYVAKTDARGGVGVRASEWVGTRLAEELNMPCPTPKAILLSDGEIAFGSRVIGSIADAAVTSQILTTNTIGTGQPRIPGLTALLSSLFAFDMFINNVDRHDKNYISIDDNGTRRFYAIDFSRSLFWGDGMTSFPSNCHQTRMTFRRICQLHGFDIAAAEAMIDRISRIGGGLISSILSPMPSTWLDQNRRDGFLEWWQSDERHKRLERLRTGLQDGTLA
jgi:hypothetical protein